jgi:hypothetical protein
VVFYFVFKVVCQLLLLVSCQFVSIAASICHSQITVLLVLMGPGAAAPPAALQMSLAPSAHHQPQQLAAAVHQQYISSTSAVHQQYISRPMAPSQQPAQSQAASNQQGKGH